MFAALVRRLVVGCENQVHINATLTPLVHSRTHTRNECEWKNTFCLTPVQRTASEPQYTQDQNGLSNNRRVEEEKSDYGNCINTTQHDIAIPLNEVNSLVNATTTVPF